MLCPTRSRQLIPSLFALLYIVVATFKYFFDRRGRLGAVTGRLSYGVYIIHIAVMGPIALALLRVDVPGLAKYPILASMTWVASNLLVYAYSKAVDRWTEGAKSAGMLVREGASIVAGDPERV